MSPPSSSSVRSPDYRHAITSGSGQLWGIFGARNQKSVALCSFAFRPIVVASNCVRSRERGNDSYLPGPKDPKKGVTAGDGREIVLKSRT